MEGGGDALLFNVCCLEAETVEYGALELETIYVELNVNSILSREMELFVITSEITHRI